MKARLVCLIGLFVGLCVPPDALAWHRLTPGTEGWAQSGQGGMRGITVGPVESSQWPGRGYGTPYSEELLDELSRMGTTWISVTPFGRIWSLTSTEISLDFEAPFAKNQVDVSRLIQQAHERGIKVLLIPHLWVETEGWRGEIDPGSPEGWAAYHASYTRFVVAWAKLAGSAGADAFSLGVECKSWSGRFGEVWTRLVAEVRRHFPGILTYSANWDEVDHVLFWDQLDLIGVNAFYPLADHNGASYAEYVRGAERARDGIRRTAEILQMPVLFVEVGYTTRTDAAVEPWLWPDNMSSVSFDEHEQARALAAVFEAFLPEPWFAGFFLWRYYASLDDVSQEHIWGFSPHGKTAEPMLERVFKSAWGVDAEAMSKF